MSDIVRGADLEAKGIIPPARWEGDRVLIHSGNPGRLLNQNRGVFTLHLLSWWRREGDMHRITAPLLSDLAAGRLAPVVARGFPFSRAGDAHRFLAERRNIGKVVLTPG